MARDGAMACHQDTDPLHVSPYLQQRVRSLEEVMAERDGRVFAFPAARRQSVTERSAGGEALAEAD